MIILLFLLVVIAVFIGMYNIYTRQKAQIKHLFQHIEPLLQKNAELIHQLLLQANPRDKDSEKRLDELTWRLKSRDARLNERVMLYNQIQKIAKNKVNPPNNDHNDELYETQKNIAEQLHHAFDAYNTAVVDYNNMLSKFPTQIVAALFNHHKFKTFEQL